MQFAIAQQSRYFSADCSWAGGWARCCLFPKRNSCANQIARLRTTMQTTSFAPPPRHPPMRSLIFKIQPCCDRRSQITFRYVSAETRFQHLWSHRRRLQHIPFGTQMAFTVPNATIVVRISVCLRRTPLPGMSPRSSTNNASSAPVQPFRPPFAKCLVCDLFGEHAGCFFWSCFNLLGGGSLWVFAIGLVCFDEFAQGGHSSGQFGRVVSGAGSMRQSARAWARTQQLSLRSHCSQAEG